MVNDDENKVVNYLDNRLDYYRENNLRNDVFYELLNFREQVFGPYKPRPIALIGFYDRNNKYIRNQYTSKFVYRNSIDVIRGIELEFIIFLRKPTTEEQTILIVGLRKGGKIYNEYSV